MNEFKEKVRDYDFVPPTITTTAYYYLMGGETWKRFLRRVYEFLPTKLQEKN